jgi:hypothetical protein
LHISPLSPVCEEQFDVLLAQLVRTIRLGGSPASLPPAGCAWSQRQNLTEFNCRKSHPGGGGGATCPDSDHSCCCACPQPCQLTAHDTLPLGHDDAKWLGPGWGVWRVGASCEHHSTPVHSFLACGLQGGVMPAFLPLIVGLEAHSQLQ